MGTFCLFNWLVPIQIKDKKEKLEVERIILS
jgi:hypothetical protein